jgi:hypothetical protein
VIQAYLGYNIIAILKQLMDVESVIEKMLRKSTSVHIALMEQIYVQEVMISTISLKELLTVLMDKFY